MPHYLGKRSGVGVGRSGVGRAVGDIDELYGGGRGGGRGGRGGPGRTLPYVEEATPFVEGRGLGEEVAGEAQPESYVDELMSSLFGKGFETIRGVGGRSQEAVYDMLARQGLLGTGAAKDVAGEMAWQTERGITDLVREMGQMRADKESEAMNMLMAYLGMMSQSWG